MKLRDIINSEKVYKMEDNEIWNKYHVPYELIPKQQFEIFGSYIMDFRNADIMNSWLDIYQSVTSKISQIKNIKDCLEIVPIEVLDITTILQARPFNEGYTTDTYAEYLEYGSCRPNEWIIQGLCNLHKKILKLDTFDEDNINDIDFDNKDLIVNNIIHKTFLKPNYELVWGNPWLLYLPEIKIKHILEWTRISVNQR